MKNLDFMRDKITELLKTSSIELHTKRMVEILLPVMDLKQVQTIYDALVEENKKMAALNEKQKRIELKYKVMVEKLSEMELKK